MPKKYFFALTVICGCIFFLSCSTPMYLPNTPIIPVCDTTNKIDGEITLNNRGLDFKINIQPLNTWNFGFGFSGLAGEQYVEVLSAKYKRIKEGVIGISAGYGFGESQFHENDGESDFDLYGKGKYQKIFIQPMFAQPGKSSITGIAFKFGFMPYSIRSLNERYIKPELQFNHYYSSTFFEGWFFHKIKYNKGSALTFYFGFYTFGNSNIPLDINKLTHGLTLGIALGFGGR